MHRNTSFRIECCVSSESKMSKCSFGFSTSTCADAIDRTKLITFVSNETAPSVRVVSVCVCVLPTKSIERPPNKYTDDFVFKHIQTNAMQCNIKLKSINNWEKKLFSRLWIHMRPFNSVVICNHTHRQVRKAKCLSHTIFIRIKYNPLREVSSKSTQNAMFKLLVGSVFLFMPDSIARINVFNVMIFYQLYLFTMLNRTNTIPKIVYTFTFGWQPSITSR